MLQSILDKRPADVARIALVASGAVLLAACANKAKEQIGPDLGSQSVSPVDAGPNPTLDAELPDAGVVPGECTRAQGLPGPKMVEVRSAGGPSYCIDSTEVTQGQYADFVKAKGGAMDGAPADMSGQPAECAFNTRYTAGWPDDEPASCRWTYVAFDPQGGHPDYPVGCVDWCDAYMYCKWAGKRLCGEIGGGSVSTANDTNARYSQWYNACSEGGATAYSYGNAYDPSLCQAASVPDASGTFPNHPAAETPQCHGTTSPFDQIFDMSGNLGEWTDACETQSVGTAGWCLAAGLTRADPPSWRCDAGDLMTRDDKNPQVGFRCCLD